MYADDEATLLSDARKRGGSGTVSVRAGCSEQRRKRGEEKERKGESLATVTEGKKSTQRWLNCRMKKRSQD